MNEPDEIGADDVGSLSDVLGAPDEQAPTFEATCPLPGCGGFTTRNHPTQQAADDRILEHQAEHAESQPTNQEEVEA